ncbi:MAG: DUF4406 domain-containing protein [Aquincola sp.]|nr:DUF4406 domain-containing protein [Aquincola sp.]
MQRIYLSGPMTGLPEMNYPAFHAEAARLRALGYDVVSPAEGGELPTYEAYMRRGMLQMLTCDTVALLPGWLNSRGAVAERDAGLICGLHITRAASITKRCKAVAEVVL